jgi:hypothetical protein
MNDTHDEFDLDWQAFCYAAGELDAEQAAAFETLLATSQEARERLAAMVALSQHAAEPPKVERVAPSVHTVRTRERVAWLMAGATMLLAAIWIGRNLRNENAADFPSAKGDREAELANVWAESFVTPAGAASDDATVDAVGLAGAALSAGEFADDEALDVDVPDWMFAALGGDADGEDAMPDDESGGLEEMLPEATLPRDG